MKTYDEAEQIRSIINTAGHIVVIQADNPDADSLGSALALEQILSELGKKVSLYCGVDMPSYLHYASGWDRVSKELPQNFDASIIVDASTRTLFDILGKNQQLNWLGTKPCVVLDHHATVDNQIDFASVMIIDSNVASTGEVIYTLAKQLSWSVDTTSGEAVMLSILGDTQGLTNDLAKVSTYVVMSELLELGVSRVELEEKRREASKMHQDIFRYKAKLIARTEFYNDNQLAIVSVPYDEIISYSPLYNPAPLIQGDMLQTAGVGIAIVLKIYPDKITGAIRCNNGYGIGADLATQLGGGGHPYASGFKVTDGRPANEIKSECLRLATELINHLPPKEAKNETVQYSF
jgi:phosphoesterase RecJ-like protein